MLCGILIKKEVTMGERSGKYYRVEIVRMQTSRKTLLLRDAHKVGYHRPLNKYDFTSVLLRTARDIFKIRNCEEKLKRENDVNLNAHVVCR